MLRLRRSASAAVTATVVAFLALGCSSGNDSSADNALGGRSGSSPAIGGQTAPNQTGANNSGGQSSRTGNSSDAASGGASSNASGGTQAGGGTSLGGNASGGQSATGQAGGAQAGGAASGGASAKGGTSTSGGSSARGGGSSNAGGASSVSVGGSSSTDGSKPTGGSSTAGGTTSVGGTSTSGGAKPDAGASSSAGNSSAGGATSSKPPTYGGGGATSLCEKYKALFPIGAAVDSQSYNTHATLLKKHFNSITPENEMKFDALHPSENSYTWSTADSIVAFATANNMKVRGHALVWHRQTPAWVFTPATRESVLAKMKAHITAVMNHYKGKIYAWDVVNEAIMDDGDYRTGDEANDDQKSQWYKTVGVDYIAEAFKYAHEADPDAKLFYNDFYNYLPARRQAIYNMLKGLLDQQIPVHGVGLQAHFNIEPSAVTTNQAYYQNVDELEKSIELYASLGLQVQITEMDVSLYIPGVTYTSDQFYTAATFTDAIQAKQAERYRTFFDLYRKHKDVITGVTLWGIADDNTWLSEFTSGRKDFPLLFDANKQPKKAYYAVVDF